MELGSTYEVVETAVAEREVSGTTLLVPIRDTSGVFELNEMSSRIWQEFKQHGRIQDAVDALFRELEASDEAVGTPGEQVPLTREAFGSDVLSIANRLEAIGALRAL